MITDRPDHIMVLPFPAGVVVRIQALFLIPAVLVLAYSTAAVTAPRYVRLSYSQADAATSVAITWTTDSPADPSQVQYGPDDTYGMTAVGSAFQGNGDLRVIHEVTLEELEPNTVYHYRVGGPGQWSGDYYFVTAPADACSAYSFVAMGDDRSDTGYGPSGRWNAILMEAMEYFPLFILNTGDIVKDGAESSQWDHWLDASDPALAYAAHMPSMGNHDDGPGQGDQANYNQVFQLPRNTVTGTEDYYFFTTGNAIFVALSTQEYTGGDIPFGEQAAWLDQVLTENPRMWKFVYFHHPVYCSEDMFQLVHPPNEKNQNAALVPVFDKHHVDLVFNGHNHWYERVGPVAGQGGEPEGVPVDDFTDGTVYVVTGGAGATAFNVIVNLFCPGTPGSKKCSGDHHFVLIRIDGNELTYTARATRTQLVGTSDSNAKVIETFKIVKPWPGGTDPCAPIDPGPEPVPDQAPEDIQAEKAPEAMPDTADAGITDTSIVDATVVDTGHEPGQVQDWGQDTQAQQDVAGDRPPVDPGSTSEGGGGQPRPDDEGADAAAGTGPSGGGCQSGGTPVPGWAWVLVPLLLLFLRRRNGILAAAGLFLASNPGGADAAVLVKGPYLQALERDGVAVAWETDEPSTGAVEFGSTPEMGASTSSDTPSSHHVVRLTGLKAGTQYHYRLLVDGEPAQGASGTFVTAPGGAAPFEFMAYGDNRSDHDAHALVVSRMLQHQVPFVVNTGDMVSSGDSAEDWAHFFAIEAELLKDTVLFHTVGNHEERDQELPEPARTLLVPPLNALEHPTYYSFDYSNSRFIVLDDFVAINPGDTDCFFRIDAFGVCLDDDQLDWLAATLSDAGADPSIEHVFVFVHEGPYSSKPNRSGSAQMRALLQSFAAGKVDLVVSGHDHYYEHGIAANGIHYVITGGGGAPLYETMGTEGKVVYPHKVLVSTTVYNFIRVYVDGPTVEVTAYEADGTELDRFTLPQSTPCRDAEDCLDLEEGYCEGHWGCNAIGFCQWFCTPPLECDQAGDCGDPPGDRCPGSWTCADGLCAWNCEHGPECVEDSDCDGRVPPVDCPGGGFACTNGTCEWFCPPLADVITTDAAGAPVIDSAESASGGCAGSRKGPGPSPLAWTALVVLLGLGRRRRT